MQRELKNEEVGKEHAGQADAINCGAGAGAVLPAICPGQRKQDALSARSSTPKVEMPLIGASIMMEGTKLGAAANLNGEYVINNVPAGNYRVIVSAVGRVKTIIDSVKVTANQPTRIDLAIEAAEIVGKQVIVEAARVIQH